MFGWCQGSFRSVCVSFISMDLPVFVCLDVHATGPNFLWDKQSIYLSIFRNVLVILISGEWCPFQWMDRM